MIGTASGISNWWMLFGLPTLYINCAALPCTFIMTNSMHVPKRFTKVQAGRLSPKMLTAILCGSWDEKVSSSLGLRGLFEDELLAEVKSFTDLCIMKSTQGQRTAHMLWQEFFPGTAPEIPDYYLSSSSYENLLMHLSPSDG